MTNSTFFTRKLVRRTASMGVLIIASLMMIFVLQATVLAQESLVENLNQQGKAELVPSQTVEAPKANDAFIIVRTIKWSDSQTFYIPNVHVNLTREVTKSSLLQFQKRIVTETTEGITNAYGRLVFSVPYDNYTVTVNYRDIPLSTTVKVAAPTETVRLNFVYYATDIQPASIYAHDENGNSIIEPHEVLEVILPASNLLNIDSPNVIDLTVGPSKTSIPLDVVESRMVGNVYYVKARLTSVLATMNLQGDSSLQVSTYSVRVISYRE